MSRSDFKTFDCGDFEFRNSKGRVKAAPVLPAGAKLVDTHCHLSMLERPGLAIARAAHCGFGFLCCVLDPGDHPDESGETGGFVSACEAMGKADAWLADARSLLASYGDDAAELPTLRFAVGVHPHNAKHWARAQAELVALLEHPLASCIGEIGLDYHYDLSPRETQREVFAAQLELAQARGLPVQLHLREAHDDALVILREVGVPQAGCIVHCFNLDAAVLAPFLELGCAVAFGGPLTFKKSWYTRLAALDVPLDRLLTETDAPYMAPEPVRGVECEPAQAAYTVRMLLDVFGYAGAERAHELASPRQADIEGGVAVPAAQPRDYAALQQGRSEAQFVQQVYDNALRLLCN